MKLEPADLARPKSRIYGDFRELHSALLSFIEQRLSNMNNQNVSESSPGNKKCELYGSDSKLQLKRVTFSQKITWFLTDFRYLSW